MHLYRRQSSRLPLIALVLLACAGTARSQTSYDATLTSQYATRGALLDDRPALQLRVEHDVETARYAGWYVGGFASPVIIEGRAQAQLIAYAGCAQRLSSTLSWDAGVTRTAFTRDGGEANYHEFYAGLALTRGNVRLFYSPAYYGEGRTVYLDINGGYAINDRVHVSVHAGLLHPLETYAGAAGGGLDARIALGTDIGAVSVEAGWQVRKHAYLEGAKAAPALTASASLRF
jgi:uncharacterized protein (TIGR02001 family)